MAQYLSAMKVSVSVNLLAGAWIWLHKQSGEVREQVQGKVDNIVNVVKERGVDVRAEVEKIVAKTEEAVRYASLQGIAIAATVTIVILLLAFFVNHNYIIKNVWLWFFALVLASAGPIAMLVTYIWIKSHTDSAVNKAGELANKKAGELKKRKPPQVPTIVD